jgi:hypothetical protein
MNFYICVGNCSLIANSCTWRRWIFSGLSQDGGRAHFLQISAPLSLINIYRMNLISAGSISLDSTFKLRNELSADYRYSLQDETKSQIYWVPSLENFALWQISTYCVYIWICFLKIFNKIFFQNHMFVIRLLNNNRTEQNIFGESLYHENHKFVENGIIVVRNRK